MHCTFEGMIDNAEDVYQVVVVAFCCNNNGGSQRGRKDLVLKRLWLFGPPCCVHQVNFPCQQLFLEGLMRLLFQFQLILGKYFTENEEAAEVAEQVTDLISWVLNHGKVHSVFNKTQAEISVPPGKVLAFLVTNMTCWTTHFIAFDHLTDLKDSMRWTVISCKDDIISAQVSAEKNCQKRQKLKDDATAHCELIDNGGFWQCLKSVVDDLEPICLRINMNQTDGMHPDKALLTFAGIYLYFQKHSKHSVAEGMMKRIEKC